MGATESKHKLDFLIIGTTKGGTTTLFEWVKNHPELYMPRGKEVPFFSDPKEYALGLPHYLRSYFGDASPDQLWGTATPQYMSGANDIMPDEIAKRIKKMNPNTKLITVLREPIDRAYSHHKMYSRWGIEPRSFEQAAEELLTPEAQKKARQEFVTHEARRKGLTGPNGYLAASEYGRILAHYYRYFDASQIRVYFADELKHNREQVIQDFFTFLGVDPSFKPKNLFTDYHKGGSKAKLNVLTKERALKIPVVGALWQRLPHSFRKQAAFAIHRWNIKPDASSVDTNAHIYKELKEYFAQDIRQLEKLINKSTPWEY